MNLLNGVFSKSSAFSKVKNEGMEVDDQRKSRSMKKDTLVHSSSTNSSIEGKRTFVYSSERNSSSSEREISFSSGNGGSCDRSEMNHTSPLMGNTRSFIRPKPFKPTANFNLMPKCNMNGINSFGINQSLYWVKYQMMMKQGPNPPTLINLSSQNFADRESLQSDIASKEAPDEQQEKMIGGLPESVRKKKVERYLQKKRRKSKAVRYECRKNLAQKRLRYQGRFISAKEAEKLDKSLIYNPSDNLVPKPIFHTVKDQDRWRKRIGYTKLASLATGGAGDLSLTQIDRQREGSQTQNLQTGVHSVKDSNLMDVDTDTMK